MEQNYAELQDVKLRLDIKELSSIFFQIERSIKEVSYLKFLIKSSQFCIQFLAKAKNMYFELTIPSSYFISYDFMHSNDVVVRYFYVKSLVPIYHFFRKGQAVMIISQDKMVIQYQGINGSSVCSIKTLHLEQEQQGDYGQQFSHQQDKFLKMNIQKKQYLQCISRPLKRLKAQKISIYYNSQQKSLQIQGTPKMNYHQAEWQLKVNNVIFDSKFQGKVQQKYLFSLKNFIAGFALGEKDASLTLTFYPSFVVFETQNKKKWKLMSKVSCLLMDENL